MIATVFSFVSLGLALVSAVLVAVRRSPLPTTRAERILDITKQLARIDRDGAYGTALRERVEIATKLVDDEPEPRQTIAGSYRGTHGMGPQ